MSCKITYDRLVGNRAIHDAAVAWILKLERKAGRAPSTAVTSGPSQLTSRVLHATKPP